MYWPQPTTMALLQIFSLEVFERYCLIKNVKMVWYTTLYCAFGKLENSCQQGRAKYFYLGGSGPFFFFFFFWPEPWRDIIQQIYTIIALTALLEGLRIRSDLGIFLRNGSRSIFFWRLAFIRSKLGRIRLVFRESDPDTVFSLKSDPGQLNPDPQPWL